MKFTVKVIPPEATPTYVLVDELGREVCRFNEMLPDAGKGLSFLFAATPAMLQLLTMLLDRNGTPSEIFIGRIRAVLAAAMGGHVPQ